MSTYFEGWIDAEKSRREAIIVRKVFLDLCGGNYHDAAILDKIVYWHEPSASGERRLTIYRDGHWWLAKSPADWWEECRVKEGTARGSITRLKDLGVIVTATYHFGGVPTQHIRIDPEGFERAMKSLLVEIEQVGEDLPAEIEQVEVSESDRSYISPTTPPTTEQKQLLFSSREQRVRNSLGASQPEAKPGRADPSDLEKFLVPLTKHLLNKRDRITHRCADVLAQKVTVTGEEYPSPDTLFKTDPAFKGYVEARLKWGLEKNYTIEGIVNSIANYGAKGVGWLDWKKFGPLPNSGQKEQEARPKKWWKTHTLPPGYEVKASYIKEPQDDGSTHWFIREKLFRDGAEQDAIDYPVRPTREEALTAYQEAQSL